MQAFSPSSRLYRSQECQRLDRIAIEEFGIPSYDLMQMAASAALKTLQKHWPSPSSVLLLCGGGNNGGDGLVLARLLHALNIHTDCVLLVDPERLKGDARLAYDDALAAGVDVQVLDMHLLDEYLEQASVVVDAMLGTGSQGELRAPFSRVVNLLNSQEKPVLALDVPTGLCADTGQVLGQALEASVTITFIANKKGLVTGQARDYVGTLLCDRLELPAGVFQALDKNSGSEADNPVFSLSFSQLKKNLPVRKASSHKGRQGHVLLVGGDKGFAGAMALAGRAALRAGAGLVSIACHPDNAAMITATQPELMCHGIGDVHELSVLIERASVIALGPGLGQSEWSRMLFRRVIEEKKLRVVDADGLNWLAHNPTFSTQWILTPHPGEAARLLDKDSHAVNADRYVAAQALQKNYGGVAVLKGAGALIQSEQHCSVCLDGNPGMASGGMGDVLTGVLAALLAINEQAPRPVQLDLPALAELGVCLHSAAADLAVREHGQNGLLASDIIESLRVLVN